MKSKLSLTLISATMLMAAAVSGRAQLTVYDNLGTTAAGGTSQPNTSTPIFGDSLTLSQGGTLGLFGTSIFNSSSGGNTGSILTGSMLVSFYDNTVPYTGGVLNKPLIGSTTVNWDFTAGGGLAPGFYTTGTIDLSGLGLVLPQNILVTQKFTQTSGTSTRNGVIIFADSTVVGSSSPTNVYMKYTGNEGLFFFSGTRSQFGYTIQVAAGGGNHQPVADAQSVTLRTNTTANITLTASDIDNDPLTYSIVASPTNGILTGTPPNVVYQPNANYVGTDAFTFKANDGQTDSVPALVSLSIVTPCVGVTIIPTYDISILSNPNANKITNTINAMLQNYACKFSDPVTVSILFSNMSSGLGQSLTYISSLSYSSYYNALVADSKSTNDTTALAHLTGGASNPVNGGANITCRLANLRALGFNANPPNGFDSFIGLNLSLCNLDRVTINPSKYDLQAVASHETDEVLGTSSGVGQANIAPPDLFRYTSGHARTYTTSGDDAYFSIDAANNLARYNQDSNGDYGDWWSVTGTQNPKRVQDAFGTAGSTPDLNVEITVLDVVGWDLVTTVAAPAPVIQSVTRTGSTLHLTWSSVASRSYQVQTKSTVNGASWSNLGSPILAGGSTTSTTDTISGTERYYRVALLPSTPAPPDGNFAGTPISTPVLEARYYLPAPGTVPQTTTSKQNSVSIGAIHALSELQTDSNAVPAQQER
jgi:hypothetical protein